MATQSIPKEAGSTRQAPPIIKVRNFDFAYGDTQALFNINMDIREKEVTAFIRPSGCGKIHLPALLQPNERSDRLCLDQRGQRQNKRHRYLRQRRGRHRTAQARRHGLSKVQPIPKSIYENIAYGLRIQGINKKSTLDEVVERCLRGAALWDEVKDRLSESALGMSGGQQQRLCIARALAVKPKILLMDEPCSALDPIATAKVEELIHELKQDYTIVIVTHNMQQAARISNHTAFFYLGKLIEYDKTDTIFMTPSDPQTEAYVSGRFG